MGKIDIYGFGFGDGAYYVNWTGGTDKEAWDGGTVDEVWAVRGGISYRQLLECHLKKMLDEYNAKHEEIEKLEQWQLDHCNPSEAEEKLAYQQSIVTLEGLRTEADDMSTLILELECKVQQMEPALTEGKANWKKEAGRKHGFRRKTTAIEAYLKKS